MFSVWHNAAQSGHVSVLEELLDRGAKLDLVDKDGWTALHFAAQNGHVSVIKMLIYRGSKIDSVMNDCRTALEIAEVLQNASVIELLNQPCKERMDCGHHLCRPKIGNVHDHSLCNHKVQYTFPGCKHKSEKMKRCMEPITWKCKQACIKFMDCEKHQCRSLCGSNHTHAKCMEMAKYTFPGCNHKSYKHKGCTEAIVWKCSQCQEHCKLWS
jgi:hypothetical protein